MEQSRPATADDLPRLVELVAAAEDELEPTRGGDVWRAGRHRPGGAEAYLKAALEDEDAHVVAGTIDGAAVGYAVTHLERLSDGRLIGRVEDLFVEPGARGVGVGERLMNDVLAWCKHQGCTGVDAVALPGNRATKNFFEGSGFTARLLIMHRSL